MKTTLDVGNHHLPPFHQPHPPFQFVKLPFQFPPLQVRPFHVWPFHVRPPRTPIPWRPIIPACPPIPRRPIIPACPAVPRCPIIPACPTIPRCPIIPAWPAIRPCPPPPRCGAAVANGVTVKAIRQPKESISFELFMLGRVCNHQRHNPLLIWIRNGSNEWSLVCSLFFHSLKSPLCSHCRWTAR